MRPDSASHLRHLRADSARFRAVLADCDPAARVPACPDWDAADLLWHLADVQWFWSDVVRRRPDGPPDDDRRPARADTWPGLLEQYDELSAGLVDALAAADPDEPAWSWAGHVPDGQTVGFTFRRQSHEALVHRLDAEQTAGVEPTPLDPALAADGVAELLEVMYGGAAPSWARFTPITAPVRIDLADVDRSIWVQPGTLVGTDPDSGRGLDGPHLVVVDDPGLEPAAIVSGTAADLDVAWWKRGAGAVRRTGDRAALDALAAALDPPLD
ncbi:maleylpyruvate isomerase family mycothiol-dependent enzyme [Nocardioides sp. C4-1]|uniref:maleylpyruvate isomerase family mycothiol-dependent enzyme n=1 Tax=Nocardioides sp. C4-1 TaxID=3151851 RepID=UPI0032678C96